VTRGLGLLLLGDFTRGRWEPVCDPGQESRPDFGPRWPKPSRRALATASSAIFSPVVQVLEVDYGAGPGPMSAQSSPPGSGVTVAQATGASYCLEAKREAGTFRARGGAPAARRPSAAALVV